LAANSACVSGTLSARMVVAARGAAVASADGRMTLTLGPGALNRDGYVLVLPVPADGSGAPPILRVVAGGASVASAQPVFIAPSHTESVVPGRARSAKARAGRAAAVTRREADLAPTLAWRLSPDGALEAGGATLAIRYDGTPLESDPLDHL